MAHFASPELPARFGVVASLNSTVTAVSLGASGDSPKSGATEGTDLLTYTVPGPQGPTATGTGLYLLLSEIKTDPTTPSDAGTSQTIHCQISYNNGAAVADKDLGDTLGGGVADVTVVKADTTTADTHVEQMGLIRAVAGTDIVMNTVATNGGLVASEGSVVVNFYIFRIA